MFDYRLTAIINNRFTIASLSFHGDEIITIVTASDGEITFFIAKRMVKMSKNLLLIDGHGLAFRGFYALPETLSAADGTPTNAILGFTTMLLNGLDKWGPDRVGLFLIQRGQRDAMNF